MRNVLFNYVSSVFVIQESVHFTVVLKLNVSTVVLKQ